MTMNCSEWEEKLNAALDGELSDAERAPLEAHLAACADCRRTRDAIRAQSADLEHLHLDSRALEERIIAAVHASSTPRRGGFRAWMALAAAAALILVASLFFNTTEGPATQVPAPGMTLQSATGPVEVAYNDRWLPFSPGNAVDPGTTLRTGAASKCELACADGSLLRLDRATEVQIQAPRRVQLRRGELFASVTPGREPFLITTQDGGIHTDAGVLDVSCLLAKDWPAAVTSVAVLTGEARIDQRPLRPENMCVVQKNQPIERAAVDPLLRTQWTNDLLRLRDKNDPEVMQRVTALLTQAGRSELHERELRAFGERGAPGLLSILNRSPDSWPAEHRRHAARVLADVAGPHEVEALVKLLRDGDGAVRSESERGLTRITGILLKSPDDWDAWYKDNSDVWACPKK
jgi:ferric-dicitrate binding protein FerR (iron transport regulator)